MWSGCGGLGHVFQISHKWTHISRTGECYGEMVEGKTMNQYANKLRLFKYLSLEFIPRI